MFQFEVYFSDKQQIKGNKSKAFEECYVL